MLLLKQHRGSPTSPLVDPISQELIPIKNILIK